MIAGFDAGGRGISLVVQLEASRTIATHTAALACVEIYDYPVILKSPIVHGSTRPDHGGETSSD